MSFSPIHSDRTETQRRDALTRRRQRNVRRMRRLQVEALEDRRLLATITGGTAPGGFETLNSAALLYWLSADSLALSNNAPVAAWNDQGAAANNFAQGTAAKQPVYVASGSLGNGLPAVQFDGDISGWSGDPAVAPNADELILGSSTAPASVVLVNSTTTTRTGDGIWGLNDGDVGVRRAAGAWQYPGNVNDFAYTGTLYVNGVAGPNPSAPVNTPVVLSGVRAAPTTFAGTSLGDYFQAGANQPRSWGGQVGEVVAFGRALNDAERRVIDNALAAKYGISMSVGDVYQGDTAGNGDYDFGVFGIGGNRLGNVALGKVASQSSLGHGWGEADKAADGNTDGNFNNRSVTHTNSETDPWWQVDLGTAQPIYQVKMYNRTDCCGDRLSDVKVEVLDGSNGVL